MKRGSSDDNSSVPFPVTRYKNERTARRLAAACCPEGSRSTAAAQIVVVLHSDGKYEKPQEPAAISTV
jgi:hypothetical protein